MRTRNEAFGVLESLLENAGEASIALHEALPLLHDLKNNLQPSSIDAVDTALSEASAAVANLQTVLRKCREDI